VHDPYMSKSKLPEPTVCPQCHAADHQGRWTWTPRPAVAHEEMCPACLRIRDKNPAEFLTLRGRYLQEHKANIINPGRIGEALHRAHGGELDFRCEAVCRITSQTAKTTALTVAPLRTIHSQGPCRTASVASQA
jgi:hypothetical protein